MVSISELLASVAVMLWALCIFLRVLEVPRAQRASAPARRRPAGYEWRKVRKLGGRLVVIRLQVILA